MRNLRINHFIARNNWRRVFILSLCFALLAGTTLNASAYHLTKVKNKSFEKDGNKDGIPNRWKPVSLSAKSKRVCNKSKHKNCSFKMVADGTSNWLKQKTLYSSGPAGVEATVSGWAKGKDLVGVGGSWIYMWFNKTGGGKQVCNNVYHAGGTFKWTYGEGSCVAGVPFDSMSISVHTTEDSGKIWFDNVKLTAVGP